ncbi:MAG TPA: type II secretion system protein [Candidatus Saccharimonadales bacterium]|nr:type II secretion system protein [Candidatus Saccharimonadales bacterium]
MNRTYNSRGFTVIEVIIVLAIASMIFLIVFLVVPKLQSNSRDYERKHYSDFLLTQLEEYKNDHGGQYPKTADDACDFLAHYTVQSGSVSSCTGYFSGSDPVTVDTKYYSVAFFNNDIPHDYIGPVDEIDMAMSHWCNTDPAKFSEDPTHKITNGNAWPFDNLFDTFVIWTKLEGHTDVYCIDNYSRAD